MEIFTYGGCRYNGTPQAIGANAAVIRFESGLMVSWVKALPANPTPTSQRAEISGLILALEVALEKYHSLRNRPELYVTIYSDSHYVIECMTESIDKWAQDGWIDHLGQQVANGDLLEKAFDLDHQLNELGDLRYYWIPPEENWEARGLCTENLNKQESEE